MAEQSIRSTTILSVPNLPLSSSLETLKKTRVRLFVEMGVNLLLKHVCKRFTECELSD